MQLILEMPFMVTFTRTHFSQKIEMNFYIMAIIIIVFDSKTVIILDVVVFNFWECKEMKQEACSL